MTTNENITIEACVENLAQCKLAQQRGAHQLELCARLDLGGTTPDIDLVRSVLAAVDIPVKVMIRPRGGDFVYAEAELETMSRQIISFKDLPIGGLVIGILDEDQQIDLPSLRALTALAPSLPFTFHKAIDLIPDRLAAIRQLKAIPNLTSILTSGGAATARAGTSALNEMVAAGRPEIEIIAAGRITDENLEELHQAIGTTAYHGRRIVGDLVVG